MPTPFCGRISCGDEHPPIRQHILAEFAVEYQLVAAGLRHLRRQGQLVEKQNAFSSGRKKLGRHPLGLVCLDPWQSSQIDRIELDGAHVKEVEVEIVRDLRDDLRLADATCAPDMQRHTLPNQRMKRLIKLGWFHGIDPFGCSGREFQKCATVDI